MLSAQNLSLNGPDTLVKGAGRWYHRTMEQQPIHYKLVRSARRTVSVEIRPDGSVLVRAPRRMSDGAVEAFVSSRRRWIETHRAAVLRRQEVLSRAEPLTEEELASLTARAREDLARRAARFAPLVGVRYGRITIRRQRTRWGSCSGKGNLNFNCLLMLAPEQVRDYVVIHELCHRRYMDHSPRFWAEVERVMPDWRVSRRWLRQEGPALLARLNGGAG